MKKAELARRYFEQGFNCCQSVVLTFAPEMGLTEELAARLASGLGAGIGRLREICGAVSGSAIVLGMIRGGTDPLDREVKASLYGDVQRIAAEFQKRNGSYICRELLGLPPGMDEPVPRERTASYYAERPCASLVACAAELLEQELLKES